MVANGLASLTNLSNKQETYETEVKLVPSSQDPTLDQFMSRHIDKIFLWKNGLIFTTRTEKSERTPIHFGAKKPNLDCAQIRAKFYSFG